jgi:hypothetical protein
MNARKYTTFALPNDLVQRLDYFLDSNTWGFRSRGEVMAIALRDFLLRAGATEEPVVLHRGPRRGGKKHAQASPMRAGKTAVRVMRSTPARKSTSTPRSTSNSTKRVKL